MFIETIAVKHDVCKSTLQHVKFMLSAVFVLAMNKGLCDANPMTGVMLPKARGSRETYAYSLDEKLAMLKLPFDAMTKAAIGLAAFAALRESEIAGLRWADYTGDEILVSRSIDRGYRWTLVANCPAASKYSVACFVSPICAARFPS